MKIKILEKLADEGVTVDLKQHTIRFPAGVPDRTISFPGQVFASWETGMGGYCLGFKDDDTVFQARLSPAYGPEHYSLFKGLGCSLVKPGRLVWGTEWYEEIKGVSTFEDVEMLKGIPTPAEEFSRLEQYFGITLFGGKGK